MDVATLLAVAVSVFGADNSYCQWDGQVHMEPTHPGTIAQTWVWEYWRYQWDPARATYVDVFDRRDCRINYDPAAWADQSDAERCDTVVHEYGHQQGYDHPADDEYAPGDGAQGRTVGGEEMRTHHLFKVCHRMFSDELPGLVVRPDAPPSRTVKKKRKVLCPKRAQSCARKVHRRVRVERIS